MAQAAVARHVPKPNSKRCGTDDYARKGVGRAGVLHVRVYRNGNPCAWFELNRAIYGLPKSKRPTSGVQICLANGKGGCAASGPKATDIGRYRVYAGPVVFPPLPPVPGIYHVVARASSCKPGVKSTFGSRKGCQRATITTRVRVF